MLDYRAWEESLSECPIKPEEAQALAPSPANTSGMPGDTPTHPSSASIEAALPSLPPAVQDTDTTPAALTTTVETLPAPKKKRSNWKIPKDGMVRRKALAIVAMRANGYTTEQISKELGITPGSIRMYIYKATKSGFLVNKKGSLLVDPTDRLEFALAHKAVDNLEKMLDSDEKLSRGEKSIKMEATMAIANGMLFKKFDQPKETTMPTNILQINIQGSTEELNISEGGAPLYVDGEIIERGDE